MRYTKVCIRCWQSTLQPLGALDLSKPPEPFVCEPCRKLEREPQGTAVRLFEPAPTQLPGQMAF